ncbi:MAG: NlpC/P60 family protein, partial [Chitinophagales bacterium]
MADYGIASLSVIPMRLKPAHTAEMVSQLLYGETYTVTEYVDEWLRIQTHFDNYTGFLPQALHTHITKQWFHQIENSKKWYAGEIVQMVTNHNTTFPILIGSTLHEFDGLNYKIGKERLVYAGNAIPESEEYRQFEYIKKISKKFLNAPYLWGGRSPFGIDCSGFVQVVFKMCGIPMPRDAYQQAELGRTIN